MWRWDWGLGPVAGQKLCRPPTPRSSLHSLSHWATAHPQPHSTTYSKQALDEGHGSVISWMYEYMYSCTSGYWLTISWIHVLPSLQTLVPFVIAEPSSQVIKVSQQLLKRWFAIGEHTMGEYSRTHSCHKHCCVPTWVANCWLRNQTMLPPTENAPKPYKALTNNLTDKVHIPIIWNKRQTLASQSCVHSDSSQLSKLDTVTTIRQCDTILVNVCNIAPCCLARPTKESTIFYKVRIG